MMHRVRKKVLKNKSVTPQVLRHSSATYYTKYLNHFQLCYRYGWSMTSKMPERYIDRAGVDEMAVADAYLGNQRTQMAREIEQLRAQLTELKTRQADEPRS